MDADREALDGLGLARKLLALVADLCLWLPDQHTRFNTVCQHQAIVAPPFRLCPGTAAILLLGAPGGFPVAVL